MFSLSFLLSFIYFIEPFRSRCFNFTGIKKPSGNEFQSENDEIQRIEKLFIAELLRSLFREFFEESIEMGRFRELKAVSDFLD